MRHLVAARFTLAGRAAELPERLAKERFDVVRLAGGARRPAPSPRAGCTRLASIASWTSCRSSSRSCSVARSSAWSTAVRAGCPRRPGGQTVVLVRPDERTVRRGACRAPGTAMRAATALRRDRRRSDPVEGVDWCVSLHRRSPWKLTGSVGDGSSGSSARTETLQARAGWPRSSPTAANLGLYSSNHAALPDGPAPAH